MGRSLLKVRALMRREAGVYFLSPMAYVFAALFLLLTGYFFSVMIMSSQYIEMRSILHNMVVIFLFVAPVLTMRLMAEERRMGTEELLMTAPLTAFQIVLGKFLAAVVFWVLLLAATAVYPIILQVFGNPEVIPILTGYLGVILAGSTFLALGLFASSLTDNQVIAGVVSFTMLLILWVIGLAGESAGGVTGQVLKNLSFIEHLQDFPKGIIDFSDVLFYLSAIAVFLFLTTRSLERRRWS
ncbi:MAG: ABC transporter permease subunit [Firmicutes bacterium]|nr:ABC transporter permease subunit [Bacillota bacterium]